jgi:hypothetical protein
VADQLNEDPEMRLALHKDAQRQTFIIEPMGAGWVKNDLRQGFPANIGRKQSTFICSSPIAEDRPGLLVTVATLGPGAGRARILPGRASTRTAGP